jgi:predicted anti-sigma-YlaC factor YlaD
LLPDSEHLTYAEAEAVARGDPGVQYREHLEGCAKCREEIEGLRDWDRKVQLLRAGDPPENGKGCPSPEALAEFVAGAASTASAGISEHVAHCDRCGAILAAANAVEDEMTPLSLRTSTPEWHREMAKRFYNESRRRRTMGFLAIAASLLVAV